MIDISNALLEIDAGLDRSEHLVAGAKYPFEELELLGEQLEDALIGGIFAVEEVYDDVVVTLPVAMAAPDPLLNALGISGQVIIHDQRTELKVNPLSSGFGRDHDPALLTEVVYEG